MKPSVFITVFCLSAILLSSCNKNEKVVPVTANDRDLQMAASTGLNAAVSASHLKITTIAGSPFQNGLADGTGKQSRLNNPIGLDLADDGYLYVADTYNQKIRKINLSNNFVSTINIPNANGGISIENPGIIRVSKDGTLNILANEPHSTWIVKPNGTVLIPDHQPNAYISSALQRDPSGDFYWMAQIDPKVVNGQYSQEAYLKKFYINDVTGFIGASPLKIPSELLESTDKSYFDILIFFPGYNGVKYIVINHTKLYKLTPSGVFSRIYKDLKFQEIYSIVSSKDSRTIYLVESGQIRCITNGVHKFLAGPNPRYHDGRDGVGSGADIYAQSLALSKDENTLYFTDSYTSTVRKMQLN